jgi:hypothetical protein
MPGVKRAFAEDAECSFILTRILTRLDADAIEIVQNVVNWCEVKK